MYSLAVYLIMAIAGRFAVKWLTAVGRPPAVYISEARSGPIVAEPVGKGRRGDEKLRKRGKGGKKFRVVKAAGVWLLYRLLVMTKRGPDRAEPVAEFLDLFARARKEETHDHTAVALATADTEGRPSARMVLLKGVDDRGFVFYTNYGSRKAIELDANPHAALCFYWPSIGKQVRVEGTVTRISGEESDAYFASRSRGSRIGAWASRQSEPLDSRARLVARVAKTEARFAGREVPRPEFWGGYRLAPDRFEVWHNQLHPLHDRVVWTRDGEGWKKSRLYP